MTDLHARLLAEIERREQIADFAQGLDWEVWRGQAMSARATFGDLALAHVAEASPADAKGRYAHYRRVLARHHWWTCLDENERPYGRPMCSHCQERDMSAEWPCAEISDLAEALGVTP